MHTNTRAHTHMHTHTDHPPKPHKPKLLPKSKIATEPEAVYDDPVCLDRPIVSHTRPGGYDDVAEVLGARLKIVADTDNVYDDVEAGNEPSVG